MLLMLLNRSRSALMSYTDRSVALLQVQHTAFSISDSRLNRELLSLPLPRQQHSVGPDPVFCRFLVTCQILLPPNKTVVQFNNEKSYLSNYVLLMCIPTTTINLPLE